MAQKNDFDVKKLKGAENYHHWKFQMENYLALKKLNKCIDPKPNMPNVSTENDPEKLVDAKSILSLSVDEAIIVHIRNAKSALGIWNILKHLYEDKGLLRRTGLLRGLMSVRLEGVDSMKTYVEQIMDFSNRLSGIGFEIGDEWLASIMLAGLTEEYNPFIMSIEGSGMQISADMIKQKLLDSEIKESISHGEVYFTHKKSKFKPRSRGFTCYNCGGKNHKSINCLLNNDESSDAENGSSKSSNCSDNQHVNAKSVFLDKKRTKNVAFSAELMSTDGRTQVNEWFIDSCASGHMTPLVKLLDNKKQCKVKQIIAANGSKMYVDASGNVKLNISKNDVEMHNVMYAPKVRANLLSVSQIVNKGNSVLFNANGCSIYGKDGELIVNCKDENGVYKIRSDHPKYASKQNRFSQMVSNGGANFVSVREANVKKFRNRKK